MTFSAAALDLVDHARARWLAERGLDLSREVGARDGIFIALYTLAALARVEGHHKRAARLFGEGSTLSAEIEDRTNVALCLEGLAAVAASRGEISRAARLWGASEALLETIEVTACANMPARSLHFREVEAAREKLEAQAWEQECAKARALPRGGDLQRPWKARVAAVTAFEVRPRRPHDRATCTSG